MLELKNIKKSYKTGDFYQVALDNISIEFRKNEFVSILGPSGSGKTTLLNVIGGLDRYDKGDLIINDKSTKKFKNTNWDAYRNNCIGFIFQNYNLINHISVLDNVMMSTILSGYKKSQRKKLAKEALTKVGLKDHMHKKPNQLSGGQMQRVAIARALVNNPDIILADEPTGALDTNTSKQIMELIKEIAKDKLVIMVTHNPELAKNYSTRIVEFKDGKIVSDTNPMKEKEKNDILKIKKTKMSYISAINLSFNNLKTKKGRTFITSFASSIGIIGIALILSLSNGFKKKIDEFEKNSLSQAPIVIQKKEFNLKAMVDNNKELKEYSNEEKIYTSKTEKIERENNINEDYINYIGKLDSKLIGGIQYDYNIKVNALYKVDDNIKAVDFGSVFYSIPNSLSIEKSSVMEDNFDILKGEFTNNEDDVFLMIDSKNRIDSKIFELLGIKEESISFDDIIGKEFKIVLNDTYYKKYDNVFVSNVDLKNLYDSESNITIKIKGIMRGKKDNLFAGLSGTGILYNQSLINKIFDINSKSLIVKTQESLDYNVLTNEKFHSNEEKEYILKMLGSKKIPEVIQIYPNSFKSKETIIKYLDEYNKGKNKKDKITYIDQAKTIESLSGSIMDAISIVLIAFSSISLIVSSIMVGIITYTSVLERVKEIGILRSLGARKKDITRVFNAETLIIGLFSGILGIVIANILIIPINSVIYNMSKLPDVAELNPVHAIILILISVTLTLIGGFIPAHIASKKDPVIALKAE